MTVNAEFADAAARAMLAALGLGIAESAALAFALALALSVAPRTGAATRHLLWWIVLAASAVLPLATIASSLSHVEVRAAAARAPRVLIVRETIGSVQRTEFESKAGANEPAGSPHEPAVRDASQHGSRLARRAPERETLDSAGVRLAQHLAALAASGIEWIARLPNLPAVLVAVWLGVAAAGTLGLARGLVELQRIKHDALPVDRSYVERLRNLAERSRRGRRAGLRATTDVDVPVAVGFRSPAILIPCDVLEGDPADVDQIAMHEYAHLERYDDWSNLAQHAIERLFWFHPVIAFAGRRIELEREIACDDRVVAQTGRAHGYATCLWKLVEAARGHVTSSVAPGAFHTKKTLATRIERLLDGRRRAAPRTSKIAAAAAGAAAFGIVVAAAVRAPVIAVTVPAQTNGANHTHVVAVLRIDGDRRAAHLLTPVALPAVPSMPADAATPLALGSPAAFAGPPVAAAPVRAVSAPPLASALPVPSRIAQTAPEPPSPPAVTAHRHRLRDLPSSPGSPDTRARVAECGNGCDLSGTDLEGADLHGLALGAADFAGANLSGANLSGAGLERARFTGADVEGANFRGAILRDAKFTGDGAERADFTNADLSGADFTGSDIGDAHFTASKLAGAIFRGTDVSSAHFVDVDLRPVVASCIGCDLSGFDLHGADLHGLRVMGDDLSRADLRGADLRDARLEGVNLENARLDGADLRGAVFQGCDLEGTDLKRSKTDGARFVDSGEAAASASALAERKSESERERAQADAARASAEADATRARAEAEAARSRVSDAAIPNVDPATIDISKLEIPDVRVDTRELRESARGTQEHLVVIERGSAHDVSLPNLRIAPIVIPDVNVPARSLPSITIPAYRDENGVLIPARTIPGRTIPAITIHGRTLEAPPVSVRELAPSHIDTSKCRRIDRDSKDDTRVFLCP